MRKAFLPFSFRHRLLVMAGCQALVIATCTTQASASAYGQLRDMTGGGWGNIPPVSGPECVSGCGGSSGSGGSAYSPDTDQGSGSRGIWGWIERWQEEQQEKQQQELQRQQQVERQNKQEAFTLNEQGNRAWEKKDWATAVDLYKKALAKSPNDKVIQQNLRNAEQEKSRQDEFRRAQSEYRQRMQNLVALMPVAKPLTDTRQAAAKVPQPGFTQAQWQEYLAAQETVARLYAKLNRDGVLSDTDAATFYAALRKRNELYEKATEQPRSTEEREQIRLFLPQMVNKALLSSVMQMFQPDSKQNEAEQKAKAEDRRGAESKKEEVPKSDAITTAFVAEFFSDKITDIMEEETGDAIENARGELYKSRYEHLIDIGHVLIKGKEGGLPAAGAETADLVISKIPEPLGPHAEFAVEGGRMYSKVASEALNRFMTDAMKATGATFDREAFWSEFNKDLTKKQKGVKEWVSFGE